MKAVSDELLIATDDGSYGHHGFVTDLLKQVMERGTSSFGNRSFNDDEGSSGDHASGKIPTLVSMNPIMVDGTGMCGASVV